MYQTLQQAEGGSKDIPLPPWSVTLHCSDGFLVETAVSRCEGVYGLPPDPSGLPPYK